MSWIIAVLNSRPTRAVATVVAFIALGLAGYVEVAQINSTRCLVAYNDADARASAARSAAYERSIAADRIDTEAENALWEAVNASQSLPAEKRQAAGKAAFDRFLTERRRATQMRELAAADRARNPLPQPPSQRCG